MPEKGTPLHTWKMHQLSNGAGSLNAKMRKERAENEEVTVWSERSVKLANCVAQKRRE
jgi:hypothetical protein